MATVASPKEAGDGASKRGDKAHGQAVWPCGRVVATLAVAALDSRLRQPQAWLAAASVS